MGMGMRLCVCYDYVCILFMIIIMARWLNAIVMALYWRLATGQPNC